MDRYEIKGKVVYITLDNGKVVTAMTSFLENMVDKLQIDMDEAVMTWLEDEGYLINDEQEELTVAAKENKVLASLHRGKDSGKEQKPKKRTVKENPTKEAIIAEINKAIMALPLASDVVIENKGKIITFKMNGEEFKIDLVQKRKKKND